MINDLIVYSHMVYYIHHTGRLNRSVTTTKSQSFALSCWNIVNISVWPVTSGDFYRKCWNEQGWTQRCRDVSDRLLWIRRLLVAQWDLIHCQLHWLQPAALVPPLHHGAWIYQQLYQPFNIMLYFLPVQAEKMKIKHRLSELLKFFAHGSYQKSKVTKQLFYVCFQFTVSTLSSMPPPTVSSRRASGVW